MGEWNVEMVGSGCGRGGVRGGKERGDGELRRP